jgi:DNA-binding response OmpR family regulator
MAATNLTRILVVAEADATSKEVVTRLSSAGCQVSEAEEIIRAEHYRVDLVIIICEHMDQVEERCGKIHRHPSLKTQPIIAVIPENNTAELDFGAGADDYVLAPCRPAELLLRVRMVLWRRRQSDSNQILTIGDINLDLVNYVVRLRGEVLDLTLKEYELLSHLATNPGRVFTRAALLNSVWGYEYFGGTRTVDVHIRRLRAKLGDWGEEMIQTVRGVGYRFAEEYGRKPEQKLK